MKEPKMMHNKRYWILNNPLNQEHSMLDNIFNQNRFNLLQSDPQTSVSIGSYLQRVPPIQSSPISTNSNPSAGCVVNTTAIKAAGEK